jgi:type IV pilus assembly protein PilC
MKQQKLDSLGVSAFCESMAMMVQSGIQTEEAVSLLIQEEGKARGPLEQALSSMKACLERGMSLSAAMEQSGIFPRYALQMVAAGEESGRLEDVLFRLSRYYAEQKTITEKLRNAVIYPAVMLVLIIAVLVVMLAMVLPAFSTVYQDLTGGLTASTYRYLGWAYGLCWVALVVMVVLAAALLGGLALWQGKQRSKVKEVLRRLPLCGSILESMGMFRFTSALATFLASGEMQDQAVLNSIPMTDCPTVEAKLRDCLHQMEEGHSFSQAAYDQGLFEPVYGRMLLAGERGGSMEQVLQRLTGLLEERCGQLVDRLTGIVDPLLSGVLMLTVGFSLLSVMLPLIGIMNAIG